MRDNHTTSASKLYVGVYGSLGSTQLNVRSTMGSVMLLYCKSGPVVPREANDFRSQTLKEPLIARPLSGSPDPSRSLCTSSSWMQRSWGAGSWVAVSTAGKWPGTLGGQLVCWNGGEERGHERKCCSRGQGLSKPILRLADRQSCEFREASGRDRSLADFNLM